MKQGRRPVRRVDGIDVAASLLARLAPRALAPRIDQLRLDARSVLDDLRGVREPSFSTPSSPPIRPPALREIDPVLALVPRPLRGSFRAIRRDLSSLARDLRGERTPPTIARAPRAASVPPGAIPIAPRRARVVKIDRETDEAVSITLEPLDARPIAFEAGQFLTLHLAIDGEIVKRAYSLSSAPSDRLARITCKRIPGGRASSFLTERLREGHELEILGPSGSFVVPAGARQIVLVAGGSGITPCWSIARAVLARDPGAEVTLIYGNRSERDVIFADAIEALAATHRDRFRVLHVLSRPERAHAGPRGALDGATFDAIDLEVSRAEIFVCGPAAMMDAVRDALLARGVARARIHEERFQSPSQARARLPREEQLVTVRRDGRERTIRVAPDRTLLEAASDAGVALPFSCAIGGCAACKCRVIEGAIEMDEPNCLSPEERAQGWALSCVGRPSCATIVEVP